LGARARRQEAKGAPPYLFSIARRRVWVVETKGRGGKEIGTEGLRAAMCATLAGDEQGAAARLHRHQRTKQRKKGRGSSPATCCAWASERLPPSEKESGGHAVTGEPSGHTHGRNSLRAAAGGQREKGSGSKVRLGLGFFPEEGLFIPPVWADDRPMQIGWRASVVARGSGRARKAGPWRAVGHVQQAATRCTKWRADRKRSRGLWLREQMGCAECVKQFFFFLIYRGFFSQFLGRF
jgi:hypothetical protein